MIPIKCPSGADKVDAQAGEDLLKGMSSGDLIEQALRDYPETRDSDLKLIVKVWELQIKAPIPPRLKAFLYEKAIHPETITRARRKFQEQGKYRAKEEVEEARYEKFKQTRASIVTMEDGSQVARLIE
jgi:hypothetical protein